MLEPDTFRLSKAIICSQKVPELRVSTCHGNRGFKQCMNRVAYFFSFLSWLSGGVQWVGLAGIDFFVLFRRSLLKMIFEESGVGL